MAQSRPILLTFVLLLALPSTSSVAHAQAMLPSGQPTWNALPGSIRPGTDGKYASPQTVELSIKSCKTDQSGKWSLAGKVFTVTATGAGIQLKVAAEPASNCRLTTTAIIDPAVPPGQYDLLITARGSGTNATAEDEGYAQLIVLGALAGQTPSTPEVDVEWKPLGYRACADTFGTHVASVFYCVQITVGNNSAYKLQITGIGFRGPDIFDLASGHLRCGTAGVPPCDTAPSTSYGTTRAVAQAGQSATFRNRLYNGVSATGVLMAAFTPYFHNPVNEARWATGAAIVSGAVPGLINMLAPDVTIRQLNNLDDESLRDNLIIPNNTQSPPFVVFVDKRDVLPRLNALYLAYQTAWKKPTPGQCHILRELKACQTKKFWKRWPRCGPDFVKKAMGNLVLAGNKVDYIQRIVVDSSATAAQIKTPAVSNAQHVVANGQEQQITLTGSGLDQVTSVTDTDPGAKASLVSTSSTSAIILITVPQSYEGATTTVNLLSVAGTVPVDIPVVKP